MADPARPPVPADQTVRADPTVQGDPTALRALAHPVRWRLIDVLAGEGTATATRCSELLGESTATCSYHLGILAKYGYITRVAGREWRDKPWRLASPDLNLSSAGLDPDGAAASRAAAAAFLDYELTVLKESLRRSEQQPPPWRQATKIMGATAWVTAEECQQAAAEVQQILDKYAGPGREKSGQGTRAVRLFAAIAVSAPSSQPDG